MRFSIIIPTLNEENYIGILLESLHRQNHQDFEVLVVDGKSEDATCEVVKSFAKKIPSLRLLNSPERGVSFQRNYGAKKATTDDLIFFDADVKPDTDFLERINNFIESHVVDILTVVNKPMSKKVIDKLIYGFHNWVYTPLSRLFGKPVVVGTFIYVTKEAFESVGGFSSEMFVAEDFDLAKRIFANGYKNYYLLPCPFIYFSVRRLEEDGRWAFIKLGLTAGFFVHFKGGAKVEYADRIRFEVGNHK